MMATNEFDKSSDKEARLFRNVRLYGHSVCLGNDVNMVNTMKNICTQYWKVLNDISGLFENDVNESMLIPYKQRLGTVAGDKTVYNDVLTKLFEKIGICDTLITLFTFEVDDNCPYA